MSKLSVNHKAVLSGVVNGSRIALEGEGVLDFNDGIVKARYLTPYVPDGFDPLLFSAMLITGHPEVSRPIMGASNPFRESSQTYVRSFDFGQRGKLVFHARCVRSDTGIDSNFTISGDVQVPKLAAVEPLIEAWIPQGAGRIDGHFLASWRTETGDLVYCSVATLYDIDTRAEVSQVQHRFVTIQIETDGHRLTQHQQSTLFPGIPDHAPGKPLPFDFLEKD